MQKWIGILGCVVLVVTGQELRSTWPPLFHPGQECLAYDGSKVPDCRDFINEITKEPYFHPHSFNCSRFWECGPTYETCLFECAHCNNDQMNNPQCKGQQALSFDFNIQWPFGPVCNWPDTIDCDNGQVPCGCEPWQSCINGVCGPQCKEDSHCPDGYYCDECNWCAAEGGETTAPPTNPPDTTTQSPDTTTHDIGCNNDDSNCKNDLCDEPDNWPYTTCEYCGGENSNECLPGCSVDSECPLMFPVCGNYDGTPHRCGCDGDEDCISLGGIFVCDEENHECTPVGVSGITNITVETDSCDGCANSLVEGGLQVTLVNHNVECTSLGLDNLDTVDYKSGYTAFFDGKPDSENDDGLGGCNFADLNVGLTGGSATWTGDGTWTGASEIPICIDFYGENKPMCCCDLATNSLAQGEATELENCHCCGTPPCL